MSNTHLTLPKNSKWTVLEEINNYIVKAQCGCGHIEYPQKWDLEHDYLMCDACRRKFGGQGVRKRKDITQKDLEGTEWTLLQTHIKKDVYGHWFSWVRCSCGREQYVTNSNLKSKRSTMCKECANAKQKH